MSKGLFTWSRFAVISRLAGMFVTTEAVFYLDTFKEERILELSLFNK